MGSQGTGRLALALAVVGVAVVAFGAAAAGIPGRASYGAQVNGDEPHYLLTALSLAEDAELDVSDEIASGRYRAFHQSELPRQAAIRPDGSQVVPHDPLLPVLLALPMRVGGWVGAKLALAGVAAALSALLVWVAARRLAVPLGVATAVTGIFAASAPLAAYGQQVYPALPAALATTVALAALTGPMRRGGRVVLGLAVVVLPWLAVKFVPVAATLGVLGLVRLWRRSRHAPAPLGSSRDRRAAVGLTVVLVLMAAGYVAAHFAWYGGLTVYASGDYFQAQGGQLSVLGTDPHYLGRARRLIGLLIGRTFGLAAWQPAWLLAVPAAAAVLRRRPPGWGALAAPVAVAWLVATFVALTMQGWWFPGRQVVLVLPLAVLVIAWWVSPDPRATRRRSARLGAVIGLGLLGVWSYVWLAAQAAAGGLTWMQDFYTTADPWYRVWRLALPDYLDVTASTWVLQGLWLAALAVSAVWAWCRAGRRVHSAG